ncbi:hypothetical protein FBU30_001637 [Linnemannia zychae]|nr:hypothetical protein FBU30_001637 [Linnemannia zychae]
MLIGGYGIVYKATGHGGRLFAIKQGRKEKGRKAIKEEGRILKVVGGHRNIVAMYDEFHYGGQRLLVLEFAARGDLRGLLLQKGLLGEPETAAIGRSMINGIMHMHEVGYLHRDLKPENILLGEDNTVVIADFGMALDFWNERCRGAYGTNGYRAPETVRKKPHSPSMDVWSFGIIIYEMLTGVNPKMVVDEDVNDISPWENLTVSDGAKAVLAGALAVECGSRLSLSELLQLKFFNMKNPVVTTTTITEVHTQSVPKRKLSQPESSDDEAISSTGNVNALIDKIWMFDVLDAIPKYTYLLYLFFFDRERYHNIDRGRIFVIRNITIGRSLNDDVTHLHAVEYLHHDLKFENILLEKDNTVLKTDLGMWTFGAPGYKTPKVVCEKPYGPSMDV